jgi:hypothetical protein
MNRTILTPLALLLTLGACAADGTIQNGTVGAASNPTPASIAKTTVPAPTSGEIVMVEAVAPVSQRGGNAALQIGSSILGALIPGPWGSVAGVATGQVGGLAMANAQTKSARYHVRLSDGSIVTVTQPSALTMSIGTPVDVLTLADGSRRIVQSAVPAPSVVPATVAPAPTGIVATKPI